jgi:hypothetical protein
LLSKLVYLELNDNYLLISKLKETSDKFFLINPEKIELKNLEFKNGIFYNPTTIYYRLGNFLHINKIKKPKLIACIQTDANQKPIKQNLNILQACLCFCKIDLKIEKIISKSLLMEDEQNPSSHCFFYKNELKKQENCFKLFVQKQNKLSRNLLSFGFTFLILVSMFFVIQKSKNNELKYIQNSNSEILSINKVLETKVEHFHALTKNNTALKEKIEKLQNIQKKSNNLQLFLIEATKQVPQSCNISSIKIESIKNATPKSKLTTFKIEGTTSNQQDITQLLRKLYKNGNLQNSRIFKIQKAKTNKAAKNISFAANSTFSFQISGEMKKL